MTDEELIDHLGAGQAALVLSSRLLACFVSRHAPTQTEAIEILEECANAIRILGEPPHLKAAEKLDAMVLGYRQPGGTKQ